MKNHIKKDYSKYALQDFIADFSFNQYVNKSDKRAVVFWEQYIAQHPEQRSLIGEAAFICSGLKFKRQTVPADIVEVEWHRLSNAIDQSENATHSLNWWKIAASLSALAFLTAFALLLVFKDSTTEVSTAYGEIKHVVMPDGSEVVLNANSTISYKDDWKDNSTREVWLTGEAFFDVRKKNTPSSRFVVHSNHAYVEVMGTQFNVNNRRGETTVVLNTGKVVLKDDHQEDTIMMKPGDLVTLHRNQAIRQRVNPTVYSAWKDKKFIFNETPLTDITKLIEENFGIKVIVKSESLKNRKLSGEIVVDNINVLLEALSKTFDIHIVRDRNTITLEEKI